MQPTHSDACLLPFMDSFKPYNLLMWMSYRAGSTFVMMMKYSQRVQDSHVPYLSLVYACSVSVQYIVPQIHAFMNKAVV